MIQTIYNKNFEGCHAFLDLLISRISGFASCLCENLSKYFLRYLLYFLKLSNMHDRYILVSPTVCFCISFDILNKIHNFVVCVYLTF